MKTAIHDLLQLTHQCDKETFNFIKIFVTNISMKTTWHYFTRIFVTLWCLSEDFFSHRQLFMVLNVTNQWISTEYRHSLYIYGYSLWLLCFRIILRFTYLRNYCITAWGFLYNLSMKTMWNLFTSISVTLWGPSKDGFSQRQLYLVHWM